MKKNKNILFMFVCFLTFFAFKFNVLAADKTLIFDYENTNVKSLINDNLLIINELDEFINTNNTNNFYYSIYIRNGRYLTVGLGNFTADFVWFAPTVNSYGVYLQSTMYGNYLSSFGRPDNYSWININNHYAVNHYEIDLLNFSTANFNTLKSNILSFFNTPYDAGTGLISQIVGGLNYFSGSNYALFYKSSLPLKYVKNDSSSYDTDIYIIDTTYSYGSYIPTYYDYISSQTPSISLSNLTSYTDNLNNIYKYSIDVDISNYDVNNYQYMYCLGEVCENLNSNNLTIDLTKNGTYIFKILDSDDLLVDSDSITISNITIDTPIITYQLSIPDSCKAYINNNYRDVCKKVSFEQSIYGEGYTYQYSVNNNDFETFYGEYSILLLQNDTIIFRTLDSSNNVLWTSSLTVNDLYTIDSSLGVFATFNPIYVKNGNNSFNYVEIYVFNLDFSLIENAKISYNGVNFDHLTLENKHVYYLGITNNLYRNTNIYLQILDSNNNVIYNTSYQFSINASNDILSFLENFNISMSGPVSSFFNAPLRLIRNIQNSPACTPLVIPIPRLNANVSLPCMSGILMSLFQDYFIIYQILASGILCYYITMLEVIMDNNDFLNKLKNGVKNSEESLKHFNDLVQSKVDKEKENKEDNKED